MANIFIIHGLGGHPNENWFPWLKAELEKRGHNVIVPQFPTPKSQTLSNWMEVLDQYRDFITPDTIFIGHSLGATFILSALEKYRITAAYLVAGFIGETGTAFDESMRTFAQKDFDFQKIKNNCKKFVIFGSDNDPYLKPEKAEDLAKKLDTSANIIKGAGHFNTASGFDKFEVLLEEVSPVTSL